MKYANSLVKKVALLMAFVFAALFLVGCNMEEKTWIDKMLSEMESAWRDADEAGLGQKGRDAAVTTVVRQYFPPQISREKSFQLLHALKDHGFDVRESRHEGAVRWPDKTIVPWESAPHPDEATIKSMKLHYKKGISYFSIKKMYGTERLILKKNIGISFKIADDSSVVDDVEAALWTDSI